MRWGVTLAAIAYVVSNITWRDRLLISEDGAGKTQVAVWGWEEEGANGQAFLRAENGKIYPIPLEHRAEVFVPGFWSLMKGINLRLLFLAVAVYPATVLLLAWRWQFLLKTHNLDPGYIEALRLNWIGLFTNLVLPGSSGGDLIKGFCIYRRAPRKRLAAVMTVFLDRVVGLISLMLVGTIAVLLQADVPELHDASFYASCLLLTILVAGLIFFSGRLRRLVRVAEIIERLPFGSKIKQVDDTVFHYRNHIPMLFGNVVISFCIHIITFFCVYWLGLSLDLKIPLIYYFAALPVIFTMGAVVPAPGGLGVLESMFMYFFSLHGATASSAVALCILYRLMTIIAALPGSIFTYREFSATGIPVISDTELDEGEETTGLQPTC